MINLPTLALSPIDRICSEKIEEFATPIWLLSLTLTLTLENSEEKYIYAVFNCQIYFSF